MTNGGDGNNGMSDITKKTISNKLKNRKIDQNIIHKRTKTLKELWNSEAYSEKRDQARQRAILNHKNGIISRKGLPSSKKGKPFSGNKEKLSEALKKYYFKNKSHNKIHYKVNQYDLNDNFIKTYNSHHDIIGILPKRILEVCRGKRKYTNKYKFKFYENI